MTHQKIALIGNMNNNFFAMARYFRDMGIDAELLAIGSEMQHFNPSCDSYSLEYMDYYRELHWHSFNRTARRSIREALEQYTVIIGCGLSPAFLNKAGMVLDVFVPYGGDLWNATRVSTASLHKLPFYFYRAYNQRKGIRKTKVVHMPKTNRHYDDLLDHMRSKSSIRWSEGVPIIYAPIYSPESLRENANKTHWNHIFREIRSTCDIMVFSHARHVHSFGSRSELPAVKGTDKLLTGFSQFLKKNPDIKAVLVTLEYGQHVVESKKMIERLGISDSVVWLPQMFRKDLMVGLSYSDVACGEFTHSWIAGGVLYEALVARKPIIAYRDDSLYNEEYQSLYPILNAHSAEQIASRLEEYASAPESFADYGRLGSKWYQEKVVEKVLAKYIGYIKNL